MFEKTRIKLTTWYLLIIMLISLLFSTIIYSLVNIEFVRFEGVQARIQEDYNNFYLSPGQLPPENAKELTEDVHDARIRLITRLGFMNLGILIFAGAAGYFLAGRTLKPIKDSMDEQNRFISDSSHELRTPLTSLRSEIEVNLMDKKLSTQKAKKILQSNLAEVLNLQTLSDRLLELAEDKETINKSFWDEISTAEIIKISINKTEKLAIAKKINIINNVKDKKIRGQFDRLTEVFVILIDNAIKYSPKNSSIQITSINQKDKAVIIVKDNGSGISEEDIEHIFDRFYRAEKSRTEDGYGLGLSIAKKIIEQHNGEIEVESKIDQGTNFKVILPA